MERMVLNILKIVFVGLFLTMGCKQNTKTPYIKVVLELQPHPDKEQISKPSTLVFKINNYTGRKVYIEKFFPVPFKILKKELVGFKDVTYTSHHTQFWFLEEGSEENQRYKMILQNQKSPPDSILNLVSNIEFEENDNYDERGLKMLLRDIYESRIYLNKDEAFTSSIKLNIPNFPAGAYRITSDPENTRQYFKESIKILEKHGIQIPDKDDGFHRWTGSIQSNTIEFTVK